MAIELAKFKAFCEKLASIDLSGNDNKVRADFSTKTKITSAIGKGALSIPLAYRQGYVGPLLSQLDSILHADNESHADGSIIEQFTGPVYEHAKVAPRDVRPELHRFLAVVSNLYRSFVDKSKRLAANVPLVSVLPPLVFFQSTGDQGPYTIPSSDLNQTIGSMIGIVSLPANYRSHPVLWSSLAHETGGHDVVHADPGLLLELQSGVLQLLPPLNGLDLGLLWSHWMDEAVADVYGVLNIGPQFAINLTAFFSALMARAFIDVGRDPPTLPFLRPSSGPRDPDHRDFSLDEHPTDLLRLHLAMGVIDNLTALAPATKAAYLQDIQVVAQAAGHGANKIQLRFIRVSCG